MFGHLTLAELRELCGTMARALAGTHTAIAGSKSLAEWESRRDMHADLMTIQPDLWHACRVHEQAATTRKAAPMTAPTDSAGRNDTRNQPLAPGPGTSSGPTGGHTAQDALPRAAGAAPTRGAQPSGQRTITICQLCRKRVCKQVNGAWYHRGNGSEFCHPGDGTGRKALPLEIKVSR